MDVADWEREEYAREANDGHFRDMDYEDDDLWYEEGSDYYDFETRRYAMECEIPLDQVIFFCYNYLVQLEIRDLFRLCPPPPVRYAPPSDRARVIT